MNATDLYRNKTQLSCNVYGVKWK